MAYINGNNIWFGPTVYGPVDTDGIFHAGQLKTLADSEYLNGSLSGEAVSTNDVSSIEHSIPCQLTSDDITDFSTVAVSRYGKNLLDSDIFNKYFTKQADGSYLANQKIISTYTFSCPLPAAIYTVSVKVKCPAGKDYYPRVYYVDGTYNQKWTEGTGEYINIKITTNGKEISHLVFYYNSGSADVQFKDFQIELGSTQTDYEEYIDPQTITANADGTVEGLTSVAPNMTLLSNTEGVVINANYYKDPDIVISNLAQSVALTGGEE